ncbi:unnamed protein product [Chironomus riparius]|uniref:CUB domain-containing protein n=1 Tax=Chironomus riparius TaxID=315576 RepID=A0A9N9RS63_9DIPT|nr:unnamed protein product [Chironomus riparius]
MKKLLFSWVFLHVSINFISNAPKSWPYMKNYDIWSSSSSGNNTIDTVNGNSQNTLQSNIDFKSNLHLGKSKRKSKVINFFSPFSVDDECLSDDGRRTGVCMNVYECRLQGGVSRGDCALGFGACCIFETTCDGEISNNVTYFTSPKFPALMPGDRDYCSLKIKPMSDEISQIRLDFIHFSLSQPNRRTGICESDIFSLEGGSSPFRLCGYNSGQHIFYDMIPKQQGRQFMGMGQVPPELKINITLNRRSISPRMWEIRVTQIPFSSRSPTGCLQYFTGTEGIIQTFNFAENGRHLANQNYRSCIRQEMRMCSIQYEPCDDNSFGIGPQMGMNGMGPLSNPTNMNDPGVLGDQPVNPAMDEMVVADDMVAMDEVMDGEGVAEGEDGTAGEDPVANDETPAEDTPAEDTPAEDTPAEDEPAQDDEPAADEEGSGGADGGGFPSFFPSFQFPSFFRSFTGRKSRQIYSTCLDRITMPCIMEDFIAAGMGNVPSCVPVHCGNSLCYNGASSCRVETSVTPFHVGIHFGDGRGNKGSPEDNIGACLRYRQLPCT